MKRDYTWHIHVTRPSGSLWQYKTAILGSGFLLRSTSCIRAVL